MLWLDPGHRRAACCSASRACRPTRARRATPTPSPARSCTRCAAARWRRCGEVPVRPLLRQRRCDAAVRHARRRSTSSAPATARSIRELWPTIERALAWIDGPATCDGDGFIEYARARRDGPGQPGLEGLHDSVFHADGTPGRGPDRARRGAGLRLCRQAPGRRAARERWAWPSAPRVLAAQAERLRGRFEEAFWCEEIGIYALALDGAKQPCRVRTSNAGHALWSRASPRPSAARASPTALLRHATSTPAGACARSPRARRATIRCPITTDRSGRTTTPCSPRAWPGTAHKRGIDRHLRGADAAPPPTWTTAASRSSIAALRRRATRAHALSGRLLAAGLGRRGARSR